MSRLARLPWFVTAPSVVAAVIIGALIQNYFIGDYFVRTRLDEASPLVAAADAGAGTSKPVEAAKPAAEPTKAAGGGADAAAEPTKPAAEPTKPAATPTPTTGTAAGVLASGTFKDGAPGHKGSGSAMIIRDASGKLFLRVENFSVTNGPDLRMILSVGERGGGEGLDLGALKATDGNFNYEIPAGTDLSEFKSVTVWCKSFPTIFAYATLEAK